MFSTFLNPPWNSLYTSATVICPVLINPAAINAAPMRSLMVGSGKAINAMPAAISREPLALASALGSPSKRFKGFAISTTPLSALPNSSWLRLSSRNVATSSFNSLGLIAGVVANLAYHKVFPLLLKIVPEILRAEWVLSGLASSLLTIIMLVLWAYLSKPSK